MSRDIEDLHPILRATCMEHQQLAGEAGVRTLLIETYRDEQAQLDAWQKGRDAAGNIVDRDAVVTNSRPGASWHGVTYGNGRPAALAYHLAVIAPDGVGLVGYGDVPMVDSVYLMVGKIGEQLGLVWGGRWKQPHDPSHYELHPNGATLSQVMAVMKTQGDLHGLVTA